MSTAPAVLVPGGRVLHGWWRELSRYQPERFWFASLLLARVEALVERTRVQPLNPLQLGVLRQLLDSPEAEPGSLCLPGLLRDTLLHGLRDLRLLESTSSGWQPTSEGRTVAERGTLLEQGQDRQVFHFLEGTPARFLPLLRRAGTLAPLPSGWKFDPAVLETCLLQPEAWKVRRQFPTDTERLILPPRDQPVTDWNAVLVAGPVQLLLALVEVAGEPGEGRLLGFEVHAEGWGLDLSAPVLSLGEGWGEVLPGLADEPALLDWKKAWQEWCHPRSLPQAEVDACQLVPEKSRLLIQAPVRLVERLRAARSDALKGEAWLLAGQGRSREAGLIELKEIPGAS
jgi:hypothetical protein